MGLLKLLLLCAAGAGSERQELARPEPARPLKSVLLLQRSAERAAVATLTALLDESSANSSGRLAKEGVRLNGSTGRRTNCSMAPCLPYDLTGPDSPSRRTSSRSSAPRKKSVGLAVKSKAKGNATAAQPVGDPLTGEEDDLQSISDEDAAQWSKMLPCELHLAGTTIQALLDRYAEDSNNLLEGVPGREKGIHSLSALLLQFQVELSKACKVGDDHILMNSIYGRFLRPASSGTSMLKSGSGIDAMENPHSALLGSAVPFGERLGEEVVVRFFVLPQHDGDDFSAVVNSLRDSLANNKSSLMVGKLSAVMKHASLTIGYQDVGGFASIPMDKLSNLALPFAISAMFTGILIWLAG